MRDFLNGMSSIVVVLSFITIVAVLIARIGGYTGDTGTMFQDAWVTFLLGGILYCLSNKKQ